MKSNLLQQLEYHSFDTYYTNNAIDLIKGSDSSNADNQRLSNIALGSIQLIPSIFLDFAIRTPVNLIFRNASVCLLNNLDNQNKTDQSTSFVKKHYILTTALSLMAVTGLCYYNRGFITRLIGPRNIDAFKDWVSNTTMARKISSMFSSCQNESLELERKFNDLKHCYLNDSILKRMAYADSIVEYFNVEKTDEGANFVNEYCEYFFKTY
jgi:hypothetical protein